MGSLGMTPTYTVLDLFTSFGFSRLGDCKPQAYTASPSTQPCQPQAYTASPDPFQSGSSPCVSHQNPASYLIPPSLPLPHFRTTAVVEHVRDGCTIRAFLLPSMHYVTVMLSGIKVCPSARPPPLMFAC